MYVNFYFYFYFTGGLLLGGLLLASLGLYALDVYATARIDQFLLDYYGPELYERYTQYDPINFGLNGLTATTENDYYGYRSLYGLKILSWLDKSYLAYEVAKETLSDFSCYEKIFCDLQKMPKEDKNWVLNTLSDMWLIDCNEEPNSICHKYERFLKKSLV